MTGRGVKNSDFGTNVLKPHAPRLILERQPASGCLVSLSDKVQHQHRQITCKEPKRANDIFDSRQLLVEVLVNQQQKDA